MPTPPIQLLSELYRQLPCLVVNLSTDGIILHANPEALRITGYEESELLGKNLWATLFPGRLFAQIPRFISATAPSPLLKDTPLTISTRQGQLRTIAFTRFIHSTGTGDAADSGLRTIVLVGVDLTDRLLDADKHTPDQADHQIVPFGPHIGNGGAIEGEIVTPLAISPPAPRSDAGEASRADAVRQIHERLAEIETRMAALHEHASVEARGELQAIASVLRFAADSPRASALFSHSQNLPHALTLAQINPLAGTIREIVSLHHQNQH